MFCNILRAIYKINQGHIYFDVCRVEGFPKEIRIVALDLKVNLGFKYSGAF